MKFPVEIREMILNLLIAPLLDSEDGAIHVRIDHGSSRYGIEDLEDLITEYQTQRAEEETTALQGGIEDYLKSFEKRQEHDRR
jgi:hypothetical protein